MKVRGLFQRDLAVPGEAKKTVVHLDGDGLSDGGANIERNGDGKIFGAPAGAPGDYKEMMSGGVSST